MQRSSQLLINFFYSRWGFNLLLILCFIIYYWHPLNSFLPELFFDRTLLVTPLQQATSLKTYLHNLFTFQTVDLQPIRDLSYALDLLLLKFYPNQRIHFWSNLAHWLIVCNLFLSFLKQLLPFRSHLHHFAITLLFALHPLHLFTVPWPATRKHLLSLLFTILFLQTCLRLTHSQVLASSVQKRKASLLACFYYFCGLLSQPINILAPLTLLSLVWNRWRPLKPLISTLAVFMTAGALFNYRYYASSQETIYKFSEMILSDRVMAFGRLLWTLAWPNQNFSLYAEVSLGHFIALFLGVPILFFLSKVVPRRRFIFLVFFLFSPLIVIHTKATNLFFLNCYALPSLTAFCLLIAHIKLPLKIRSNIKIPILILASLLLIATLVYGHQRNRIWTSTRDYHEYNYQNGDVCMNAYLYVDFLWTQQEVEKAVRASRKTIQNRCALIGVDYSRIRYRMFVLGALYDDELPLYNKWQMLQNVALQKAERTLIKQIIDLQRPITGVSLAQKEKIVATITHQITQQPQTIESHKMIYLYLDRQCAHKRILVAPQSCQKIRSLLKPFLQPTR